MSLDQRNIEIGGEQFVIGKLPTSDALRFGVIIGRIFGSVISGGLEDDLNDDQEDQEDETVVVDLFAKMNVSRMIDGLMGHMDERKVPALIKEMVSKTIYLPKYSEPWYESRFAGNLDDLMELLTAIFEDNFGGAIETAKKKFQGLGQTTSEKSLELQAGENGTSPTEPEASPESFFDPSAQNIAHSSRQKKNSRSTKSST